MRAEIKNDKQVIERVRWRLALAHAVRLRLLAEGTEEEQEAIGRVILRVLVEAS